MVCLSLLPLSRFLKHILRHERPIGRAWREP